MILLLKIDLKVLNDSWNQSKQFLFENKTCSVNSNKLLVYYALYPVVQAKADVPDNLRPATALVQPSSSKSSKVFASHGLAD